MPKNFKTKHLEANHVEVKKNAKFHQNVKIDGHLTAHGKLNFDRESISQSISNSGNGAGNAVTLNSSSGTIILDQTSFDSSHNWETFTFNNTRIEPYSILLLTMGWSDNDNTLKLIGALANVANVHDGSCTIHVKFYPIGTIPSTIYVNFMVL